MTFSSHMGSEIEDLVPPKPSWKRRAVKWGVGLVVVLGVLIGLAPTVAGWFAPGVIASQAGKSIKGKVKVEGANFSWWGPQKVGPVTVLDQAGQQVAKVSVSSSAGLLGLATGGRDLGTITIEGGQARIVRNSAGQLNIEQLIISKPAAKPGPGQAPGPIALPKGFKARVVIKNLQATFEDQTGPGGVATPSVVALTNVNGEMAVDPAQPLTLRLSADAQAGSQPGSISVDVTARQWADATGVVTIESADAQVAAKFSRLPVGLIDALVGVVARDQAGNAVPMSEAIGSTLEARVEASGTMQSASIVFSAVADRLSAGGELRIDDGVLTTATPLTMQASGTAMGKLVPALGRAMQEQSAAHLTRLPDARVTIDQVRVQLPAKAGERLNLRTAAGRVTVETSEILGQVRLAEGQASRAMRIAPLTAVMQTADLAGEVRVTADTSATLDKQPAGEIMVDLTAAGLLDEDGGLRGGVPQRLSGQAAIRKIATAIAQPFVAGAGLTLDLARDIGPELNLELSADSGMAAGQEAVTVALVANAEHLRAKGSVDVSSTSIKTRGEPVTLELDGAGRVLQAMTAASRSWRVAAASGMESKATFTLQWLDLPLGQGGAVRPNKAGIQAKVAGTGLALIPPVWADVRPILVRKGELALLMNPGGAVETSGQLACNYGVDFGAGFNFKAQDVVRAAGEEEEGGFAIADPFTLRPEGTLDLAGVPVTLLRAFTDQAVSPQAPTRFDVAGLLADAVGPVISGRLTTGKEGESLKAQGTFETHNAKVTAVAGVSESKIDRAQLACDLTLTPESLAAVLDRLAPEMKQRPRLAQPSAVRFVLAPMLIPLGPDHAPLLAQAGTVRGTISIPERLIVEELAIVGGLKGLGVEGLELTFEAPVTSLLAAGGRAGEAKVTVHSGVLGPAGEALGTLQGGAQAQLASARPAGAIALDVRIDKLDPAAIDRVLGKEGLAGGSLGGPSSVALTARVDPRRGAEGAVDYASAPAQVSVTLTAPNVTSQGPLTLRRAEGAIELTQPARFTVRAQPSFVNALLESRDAKGQPMPATITLTEPTTIDLRVDRLVLPAAAKGGKAPAPDVGVTLTLPETQFKTAQGTLLRVGAVRASMDSGREADAARTIALALEMDGAQVEGSEESGKILLTGTIRNYVDAQGQFEPGQAVADLRGEVPAIPTAIVDAIARQGGLLVDALGPTIQMDITVTDFPVAGGLSGASGGTVALQARSDRAVTTFDGAIADGVLTTTRPMELDLLEVSAALAARLVRGLPLLGNIQKTKEHRPATIRAERLAIPLSGDVSKLNGEVRIDPGEAVFAASTAFGELLDIAKLPKFSGSRVGQRLEPVTVTFTNGVVRYERWKIPLGDFTFETEGTFDLVHKQVDFVTWIPLGALTDEGAGVFNIGLGGALGKLVPTLESATMMPFRTKGPSADPKTSADVELFAKTTLKNLRPDQLLEKGLERLFPKPEEKPPPK